MVIMPYALVTVIRILTILLKPGVPISKVSSINCTVKPPLLNSHLYDGQHYSSLYANPHTLLLLKPPLAYNGQFILPDHCREVQL